MPQNHTLPGGTTTVVVPAYTDIADGPKAFIDFADSLTAGGGSFGLPAVTSADDHKFLSVQNGAWAVAPRISMGTTPPDNADGADGDIYIVYKP